MILFDLRCRAGHVFEAWFASSTAYADQVGAGQVPCPFCGDTAVAKAVMAPSIAAKGNRRGETPLPALVKHALQQLAAAQTKALAGSQWVGDTFATRARAMHQGEEDHKPIHGLASLADVKSLVDDGVAVAPLPLPVVPPEKIN
ncbi:hypothetical protein FHT00_001417 [Sphingomonas insulae]|uniref:DUF1178 family protein n=1 Tax=Sphingomonas insulae TaxID=424800 RepID=A0ABN1HZQ0_9SPHN|nr:DUF1178 family protein [Sphingomonas insulae]NIJ29470.1 hypothetical protein [Sphingomonas insulae]